MITRGRPSGRKDRLVLYFVGQAVEAGQIQAGLQRRLMHGKVITVPPRRRRNQAPPQRIVDYYLHRGPLPVDGVIDQTGHVRIQSEGRTHRDTIVPNN
jgi:hypothetical protein